MKKNTRLFLRSNLFIKQILFIMIGLVGFNYLAVADGQITDNQIIRAARLAKATGTTITIVTTTVTIRGGNKMLRKNLKKKVINEIKSQKSKWQKISAGSMTDVLELNPDGYVQEKRHPPVLGAPPRLNNTALDSSPPVLESQISSPSNPPVLGTGNADGFY